MFIWIPSNYVNNNSMSDNTALDLKVRDVRLSRFGNIERSNVIRAY